ncbi:MAG TPA: GlsB/YeaQ/YmgE family stress response membrane protein [Facklamia tabacinasalis]|uniref:GlsB/YeaQ/YmgE family stress response membrane protein n=1 Tax=Ruoffia tabacinasalis TaxID=87458 RepID=UPI001DDB0D00|nr:GlsB/YeaQ/YmgE family stress response membrane protein [Ruoffia tabacinasalis]
MGWLWSLIVGGIIGWIAGMIMGRDIPGGVIGNIIAGFVGSWIGNQFLSGFGPEVGGFFIIPALLGAVILIAIVSFILRQMR